MAAMSRGTSTTKPPAAGAKAPHIKKRKGGTVTTRNHRWEPFSVRIAKLKVEPIRRGRNTIIDDAELDASFSYFQDSLDEWRDLNVSEPFFAFARKVTPFCGSLPQILHHSDRIVDLLVEYIAKGDSWSAEPLLSLMAHFAHDLGVRFEKYFERVVTTVAQLAAKHQSVEVIEWSFTCLAWLFKYLSRLLVPDLRPLFDLMAPLLGTEHQKAFVTRFAAESLGFLVRKAGAAYHRDKAPLKLILKHVSDHLSKLQGSGKDHEFQKGLMVLFSDSIKGVQNGLHSCAPAVLEEMILQTYAEEHTALRSAPLEPILSGVVVNVMHHCTADSFEPLLNLILQQADDRSSDLRFTGLSARLLFVVCGLRIGSRVQNWQPIMASLKLLLEAIETSEQVDLSDRQDLLSAAAVVFQYCSLDVAISNVQLLERFTKGPWETQFLSFCNIFAKTGTERFQTLLLPYFKKFVAQKADDYTTELCTVLPDLDREGALPQRSIQPTSKWCSEAVRLLKAVANPDSASEPLDELSYKSNAMLEASKLLAIPADTKEEMTTHLFTALENAVRIEDAKDVRPIDTLATGNGFMFLIRDGQKLDAALGLWTSLCNVSFVYGHSLLFWDALLALAEGSKKAKKTLDLSGPHREPLYRALMRCLCSPSHGMRLAALGIIKIVASKNEQVQDIISTTLLIEQSPLNLDTARSISMRIRQLAKTYPAVCSDEWVGEAIPTFCFGLLHYRLSQIWNDACSALKDMCATKDGENHVSRLAFEWLSDPVDETYSGPTGDAPEYNPFANDFQCTNIMQLEHIAARNRASSENMEQGLKSMFEWLHAQLPFIVSFSRTQALVLLNTLPHVAEKKSRLLVPVLLRWALEQPMAEETENETNEPESSEGAELRWGRKDQKALLSVFSKFGNPKVLFRTAEVYDALLVLLSNGDVEIQKAALKAILTWKNPAITRYQENLFNLLDDARFREEISVFMDVNEEESHLQEEHRAQLLPVILRLLYGKVISGRRGQEQKRKAVFIALTRFPEDAIRQFLSISFGPLSGVSLLADGRLNETAIEQDLMSPRKQLGMLNMLEDMLNTLETTLTPFTSFVVGPLLYCLVKANRGLSKVAATPESADEAGPNSQLSLLRTIRQRGLHSLNILFESCPEFSWESYTPVIVQELVNPRLQHFAIETAQSVSGLLRLFAAWSKSPRTAPYLVQHNRDILVRIVDCLGVPSAKDEVKIYVLDNILRSLISIGSIANGQSSTEEKIQRNLIQTEVIQPYAKAILGSVGDLLRKSPSKELLESGVNTVAELAPHVVGSVDSRSMIEISTFLLKQPLKRVNPHTKLGLLKILHGFIPRCDAKDLDELFDSVFDASCSLFSFFRDRASRLALCDIVQDLSDHNEELEMIAKLCHDLNSFSTSRVDQPDFDRRATAFHTISEEKGASFSLVQWKPLVYNMLYYIRDNDELSIRVNASLCLRRFIDASRGDEAFKGFITAILMPGLQNGMREASELVRIEYLAVLAHLVRTHAEWAPVADMHILLGTDGDEESSVFGNILHIQGHRRLRALRKLASHAPQLQAGNICHLLLPLVEHFIFNKSEDENAHNLAGEASRAVSALSQWLEWPQFRSLTRRFIGYLKTKEDMQKTIIKLLAGLMDSLNEAGRTKGYVTAGMAIEASNAEEEDGTATVEADAEDAMEVDKPVSMLTKTLPAQDKLTTDVIGNILPPLTDFLHNKDDSTVSLRVPIAVAVTKVLLVLPPQEIENRLPGVLLDICHILKSKSQEGRDMSRNTLTDIAVLTGPTYLGFILKSLRTALQRGFQLHVLSFTLHHILVKMAPSMKPGDIDYCLPEIIDVIMDDTFGVTGQEKDAEEYISQMKEVKSSKSYDSMDLVSRSATPKHLVDLISPIKSLLLEQLNGKIVNKIDELLRRIGLGILQNPTLKDRDILVFCYELIQDVYKITSAPKESKHDDRKNKRFLVNMKGGKKSGARGSTSSYLYKITRFSLDILRTVLRKHEDLQTPQNLAGFLPILGDALVQGQEEVQVSAVRLLTTIIRVPLPALDKDCPVYVTQSVLAIKNSPSTNTELSQASLKLIAAIMRDRPNVEIKERDLAQLLKRLLPDIDEPDRQGILFGFLKAIMLRKIVIAEVYEVMDKVATMLVTNQTRSARDLARSSYFYFLIEYPQARNRFMKQMEFLVRNLRYQYFEGRQSVMEALNLILTKVGDGVLQDVLPMMFLPLVHSMANDDSSDCRTMAGALVSKLFERADSQRLKGFTEDIKEWLDQDEDTGLKRLGIQCWGLYFEATEAKPKEVAFVLEKLQSTIEEGLARRDDDDWELIYYSLNVFAKLCKASPDSILMPSKQGFWVAVQTCVSYPHAWVKLTAAKLIGTFFAHLATTNGDGGLGALPLEGSHGLQLTEESMIQLANSFIRNLSIPNVTEDLCAQSVRNLAFLARCFAANGATWDWQKSGENEEAEEVPEPMTVDVASDDEEFGGFSPAPESKSAVQQQDKSASGPSPTAIHRLVTRLSGLVRRETKIMKVTSLYPKTATMTLLETLITKLDVTVLATALPYLLTTLSTMVDPATTVPRSTDPSFNDTYKALIDKASEILGLVQKRMGTAEYLTVMNEVQKGVKQRREDRRSKRKIEAITMPEKHGLEKRRRHEVGRVKRKEKSAEERGQRRGW